MTEKVQPVVLARDIYARLRKVGDVHQEVTPDQDSAVVSCLRKLVHEDGYRLGVRHEIAPNDRHRNLRFNLPWLRRFSLLDEDGHKVRPDAAPEPEVAEWTAEQKRRLFGTTLVIGEF